MKRPVSAPAEVRAQRATLPGLRAGPLPNNRTVPDITVRPRTVRHPLEPP